MHKHLSLFPAQNLSLTGMTRAGLSSFTGMVKVVFLLLAMTIVSCKPSLPSGVISEGDMEDILYDYLIAQSIRNQTGEQYNEQRMYNDILEKYDYTQAEFDSSMVYYTRHYRLINNIYQNIEERLMEKTVAMGGNVQDLNSMGEGFSSSDTTNVWNETTSILFTQFTPYNVKQFELKPDTAYKAGDKFILSFDSEFIVQDGRSDLVAMLAVKFQNDSIASTVQHFSSPLHATLSVSDNERLGIKAVSGFITFVTGQSSTPSTKIALARNIKLIRMHTEDPTIKATERARADSLQNDSIKQPTNGIQKTPLDSTSGTRIDTLGREGIIIPKERQTRP